MERILALACEPWQTKAMAKLLNHLDLIIECESISLGIMDFYQMVHQLDTFNNIKLPKNTTIHSQDSIYRSWQNTIEDPELLGKINLREWESINCTDRALEEIELGNQLIQPWERDQFVLPISKYWKKRVLEDTIIWCENYFKVFKPTVVISIERFELANSIFSQICKREKIPMLNFISSRVGSRWIMRDDFGYGCSDRTWNKIVRDGNIKQYQDMAELVVKNIIINNKGAYSSDSRLLTSSITANKFLVILKLIKDLRKLAGNIYARHIIEPKNYSLKVYRFEENHFKLTKFLLRRLLIRNLRAFGFKFWGQTKFPPEPYIVWALHYRPETSGLVLGDGRDEVFELEKVADQLPVGWILAVKENPLMLGERRKGFYRKLRNNSKIRVIDSLVNTIELIKESNGVVGISGTILLEAAAIGVPACALGHPEFDKCLTFTGWDSFPKFIDKLLRKESIDDSLSIKQYISYVLANSDISDVSYLSDDKSQNLEQMMARFANKVREYLNHNKL